jgi:hypothetical protein
MSERRKIWADFARVVDASGGPKFVAPDGAVINALRNKFSCPPWFEDLLRNGYPTSAIKLGHMAFFPPLTELIEFRSEDHGWPQEWLPIEFSGGHRVLFLRCELPGDDGVWEIFRDGDEPNPVHTPPKNPEWKNFDDFIAALRTFYLEARDDGFLSRDGKRWLRSEAVARIEEHLGKDRAQMSFEFFGIWTPEDVRAAWDSDRRTAFYAMMLTGLLTALAAAFIFMPGGRGCSFALVVGALPAGLLIYSFRSWRRSRVKRRSLQTG